MQSFTHSIRAPPPHPFTTFKKLTHLRRFEMKLFTLVTHTRTHPRRQSIIVPVPARLKLRQRELRVVARRGEEALLKCRAVGHPKPRLQWRRQGMPLLSEEGETSQLRIRSVSRIGHWFSVTTTHAACSCFRFVGQEAQDRLIFLKKQAQGCLMVTRSCKKKQLACSAFSAGQS